MESFQIEAGSSMHDAEMQRSSSSRQNSMSAGSTILRKVCFTIGAAMVICVAGAFLLASFKKGPAANLVFSQLTSVRGDGASPRPGRLGAPDEDAPHGCQANQGLTWCPHTSKCIRGWIESCPGGTTICQEWCSQDHSSSTYTAACRCHGTDALDYVPAECSDLATYGLQETCGEEAATTEAFAVIGESCSEVYGCRGDILRPLPVFETLEECTERCISQDLEKPSTTEHLDVE